MTRFRKSLVSLAAIAVLAGCGETSGRYLIDTPAPTQQVRVPLSTIEVRDVTLPDYVSSAEIMVQSEDGALRPVANAIWADNPVRGFTLMLARNLDTGSNAAAMTEPWPLTEPPHARVEVRVEQMVAQIDGTFRLTGQFAIGSPDLVVRVIGYYGWLSGIVVLAFYARGKKAVMKNYAIAGFVIYSKAYPQPLYLNDVLAGG